MAITLGHLYLGETVVATGDAVEVLATACNLEFDSLIEASCNVMIGNLSPDTICVFLQAAVRVNELICNILFLKHYNVFVF